MDRESGVVEGSQREGDHEGRSPREGLSREGAPQLRKASVRGRCLHPGARFWFIVEERYFVLDGGF